MHNATWECFQQSKNKCNLSSNLDMVAPRLQLFRIYWTNDWNCDNSYDDRKSWKWCHNSARLLIHLNNFKTLSNKVLKIYKIWIFNKVITFICNKNFKKFFKSKTQYKYGKEVWQKWQKPRNNPCLRNYSHHFQCWNRIDSSQISCFFSQKYSPKKEQATTIIDLIVSPTKKCVQMEFKHNNTQL